MKIRMDPSAAIRSFMGPMAGALGLLTLAFYAAASAMHLLVDRSAWHIELPRTFRLGFLAYELTVAAPLSLLVALFALVATRKSGASRRAAIACLALVFAAWFASWGVFWMTGRFLDKDAIVLALASPGPMLLHALQFAPLSILLLPACALGLAFGFPALARYGSRARPGLRGAFLAAALLTAYTTFSASNEAATVLLNNEQRIAHPEGGTTSVGDLYVSLRDDRTGPVAYLRATFRRPSLETAMSPAIEVTWRERVPYLAGPLAAPYNVILLVVESLRSDELRAWGSSLPVLPSVDRIASEGVVFLDHSAVATHSNYSAVAPVSGQYPLRHENLHLYPESPGYPRVHLYDVLKPLGYRTAIISSQNERWGGMANFLASSALDHFFHSETFSGQKYVATDDAGFARYTMQFGRAGKIDDRLTIDEAVRWIGNGGQAPFFAYINLQNSHVPYPIPDDAPTPFGPRRASFPIRFNFFPADSADVVRGVYRNALHYVDAQVGRLLEHLRATGQLERTILVVMGDHGQGFLEHGFGAHGNELYEELLQTPLIIRAPRLKPEVRRGLAQHVDIAPTVLGLLGLPPHSGFQGIDLFNGERAFAYSVVQTTLANQYGISDGRRKLVVDGRHGSAVLRDLASDPRERFDHSARHTAAALLLRERVDTWRAAQLGYYRNPVLQTMVYAPVLRDARVQPIAVKDSP